MKLSAAELTALGYQGLAKNPLNRTRAMCAALAAAKADRDGKKPNAAMDALMASVGFSTRCRSVSSEEIFENGVWSLHPKDYVVMLALPDGSAVGATKGRWTAVIKWIEAWEEEFLSAS